jgi:hypothetical protein
MRCCNLIQLLLLIFLLPLHKGLVACPKYILLMHMIPPWISLNFSIHTGWYLFPIFCSFLLPSELHSLVSSKHCILKQLRTKHIPQQISSNFLVSYSNIQNFFHQMVESHFECAHGYPSLLRIFLPVVKMF